MWERDQPGTIQLTENDGFGKPQDSDTGKLVWIGDTSQNKQRVHYLHGALHLLDTDTDLIKYRSAKDRTLLEQIRDALGQDMFPLFVAEGTSKQKLRRIKQSPYLYNSLRHFGKRMKKRTDTLFIFGHNLDTSDDHVLNKIKKANIRTLYVSVHGNPNSNRNQEMRIRANALAQGHAGRGTEFLKFYTAESAEVWRP